jgi:hypothetical protein
LLKLHVHGIEVAEGRRRITVDVGRGRQVFTASTNSQRKVIIEHEMEQRTHLNPSPPSHGVFSIPFLRL